MSQPPGHADPSADNPFAAFPPATPAAGTPAPAAGVPAGYPAVPPPEYVAAVLSGLESAGVNVPGMPRAQAKPRSTLRIVGLGVLVVGLAAVLVRGYLQQRQHFHTLTIWQVIWLTAPIAAAGAFVAYRYAAGRGLNVGHLMGLVVGTAGTSYLTGISSGAHVSNSLFQFDPTCLMQNTCTSRLQTDNPATYVLKVVNNYWHVYGTVGFVSAAAVGAVVGIGLGLLNRRRAM